jgi:hypothetical protein
LVSVFRLSSVLFGFGYVFGFSFGFGFVSVSVSVLSLDDLYLAFGGFRFVSVLVSFLDWNWNWNWNWLRCLAFGFVCCCSAIGLLILRNQNKLSIFYGIRGIQVFIFFFIGLYFLFVCLLFRLSDSRQGAHPGAGTEEAPQTGTSEHEPLLSNNNNGDAVQPTLSDSSEDFVDLDDPFKGMLINCFIFLC